LSELFSFSILANAVSPTILPDFFANLPTVHDDLEVGRHSQQLKVRDDADHSVQKAVVVDGANPAMDEVIPSRLQTREPYQHLWIDVGRSNAESRQRSAVSATPIPPRNAKLLHRRRG
jgi:hypothetical protein